MDVNREAALIGERYGLSLTVIIDNFDFTDVFTNAVEAKQVAEQEKLRAQTEQEKLTMEAEQKAARDKIEAESSAAIAKINAEADLEVQKINPEACRLLRVRNEKDVLGDNVIRLMEPDIFRKVRGKRRPIENERTYLTEYECYVDRTILYNGEYHLFICIMRDVTEEMRQQEKKMEMRLQAVDIANDVAKKQMKIVQDIASLLGETAADTLIAIDRLKETISDD